MSSSKINKIEQEDRGLSEVNKSSQGSMACFGKINRKCCWKMLREKFDKSAYQ